MVDRSRVGVFAVRQLIVLYLVVYDISSDRQRARLAKVLEAFGARVQGSVFEVRIAESRLDELRTALSMIVGRGQSGEVRVYPICVSCYNDAFAIGDIESAPVVEGYLIV